MAILRAYRCINETLYYMLIVISRLVTGEQD